MSPFLIPRQDSNRTDTGFRISAATTLPATPILCLPLSVDSFVEFDFIAKFEIGWILKTIMARLGLGTIMARLGLGTIMARLGLGTIMARQSLETIVARQGLILAPLSHQDRLTLGGVHAFAFLRTML